MSTSTHVETNVPALDVRQALIYTANRSPQGQATSEGFAQHGISGLIASPLGDVAIHPVPTYTGFFPTITFLIAIIAMVQSLITNAIVTIKGGLGFTTIVKYVTPVASIFSFPDVVVSFGKDNAKEMIEGKLQSIGFRKEVQGRRTFYRGQLTPANQSALFALSPQLDTYAPFGAVNIAGYFALKNLQTILLTICACIKKPAEINESLSFTL